MARSKDRAEQDESVWPDMQMVLELWAYLTLNESLRDRPLSDAEEQIYDWLTHRALRRKRLLEERFGRRDRRSGWDRRLAPPTRGEVRE